MVGRTAEKPTASKPWKCKLHLDIFLAEYLATPPPFYLLVNESSLKATI